MKHIKHIEEYLLEKKYKVSWKDSDAPDAEGRFKELGIKDLASWLIKTRKKDLKKISGSLTQQIVFNRGKDPKYAEKMEKTRKEVYKQLGREDLLENDSSDLEHVKLFEEYEMQLIWEKEDNKTANKSPIDNPDIEKALKKKAEETGVSIGIIRAVMRRGMAAWKSGHRPGAGQEQWGYARVNSFLTKGKGTWGKADKDLASQVKESLQEGKHGYFAGLSDATIDKKKLQMKKQADMEDDDPDAYEEMPGDKKGKKNLKTSKHTLKYHEMFGKKK